MTTQSALQSYANGSLSDQSPERLNSKGTLRNRAVNHPLGNLKKSMPAKSSYLSCNGAVCLSDITVTQVSLPEQAQILHGSVTVRKRGLALPPPKKATYGHQIDKGMIKLPRRKEYNNSGKSVLLHVGIDKEKEYILDWMRNNFDNVSENVWIILAKHIEEVEKSRTSYVLTKKGKRMTAQDKFFALVEKWG